MRLTPRAADASPVGSAPLTHPFGSIAVTKRRYVYVVDKRRGDMTKMGTQQKLDFGHLGRVTAIPATAAHLT
jgi:hypothetical protein